MSREIKFRAWNHIVGRMSKSYTFEQLHKEKILFTNIILLQYTGFKDKSDEEIYEGDIIDSNYFTNAKVVFWRGGWHLETSKDSHYSLNTSRHSFEIIGNIYENPELLK